MQRAADGQSVSRSALLALLFEAPASAASADVARAVRLMGGRSRVEERTRVARRSRSIQHRAKDVLVSSFLHC